MATKIRVDNLNSGALQSGLGEPTHLGPIGTLFTNKDTGDLYINQNGLTLWKKFTFSTGGTQDLQSVTDNGSSTNNSVTINSGDLNIVGGNIVLRSDLGSTLAWTNNVNATSLQALPLNDAIINLPSTSGTLVMSVNGILADSSGNVDVPIGSGNTVFTSGLTASTISATTYQNLPTDIFTTGATYGNNTFTFRNNTGGTYSVLFNTLTGLTVNGNLTVTGNTSLVGLTATTISATTYQNLPTDIRTTGSTYSNNTFTFTNNTGGTYSVLFNTMTGLTVNGNLTVTGTTSSGTISATTYQNLPTDIRVTGASYSNNTFTFTNNTGGTFNVLFNAVTGLTATTISATTYQNLPTDIFTTGATYNNNNTFTYTNNTGGTFNVLFNTLTGLTVNGNLTVTGNTLAQGLTATTISATTYRNIPIKYYAEFSAAPTNSPIVLSAGSISIGDGSESRSTYMLSFGQNSGRNATGTTYSNFIGVNAGYDASGSSYCNFIGSGAGYGAINTSQSNFIGSSSGFGSTGVTQSNFLGYETGRQSVNLNYSNVFGYQAGYGVTNATYVNFMGNQAGYQATNAQFSNFIGFAAGTSATNAQYSNFIGYNAGLQASNASYSTFIGYNTGKLFVGNNVGSNNIIIGTNVSLPSGTTNSLNIGGVLFGTGLYSNTGGDPSITSVGGRIGINVVNPTSTLDVGGNLTVTGTTSSASFTGASNTISGTKGSVTTSGSTSTAFINVSGSNTVGGTGYTDFIRVTNTAAGATNPNKTIRVNNTGGIEFLNSAYNAVALTLGDNGTLFVGGGNIATTSNNDATSNYIYFNGNGSQIYDDGNFHIHTRGNGNSMWINTNNAAVIIGGQSPVAGGGAASGIIMGSGSTSIRAFANIYGGKTYTIGSYGFLATSGAGTGAGTTATYGLYVQQRVEATEFDATSDERLKDIQGEIELGEAIKLVKNVKPIKFTWKNKESEGVKAGYSAQQVVKSGFKDLIGHIQNENLTETTDDEGFTSPDGFQLTMSYDQVTPYHGVVLKHLLEKIEQLEKEIKELKAK